MGKLSLAAKIILLVSFYSIQNVYAQRVGLDLSSQKWRVWLDSAATWQTDSLYLPRSLNLLKIPENAPTCNWETMFSQKGKSCALPASFEEIFGNGNPTWRYHGVGWFYCEVDIPAEWKGKNILLNIEKYRQRIEIYVNEHLAGYDIVAETPVSFDISEFVNAGDKNRIALRITNPGGQRGWNDSPVTSWGNKYKLIPGHDFGGVGNVSVTATSPVFIQDIFVKNLLPAGDRNIEVRLALKSNENLNQKLKIDVEILPTNSNTPIYTSSQIYDPPGEKTSTLTQKIRVPQAKLWDTDSPNLYYCRVRISGEGISDDAQVRFGFRTFEVKANAEGKHNFYLNGKRVRIRSAIDWGYYWQTGFYANDEMARKSVENAKAIGHNCISFHRRIGEPLVMKYADELGVMIYEEPGGGQGVDELQTPSWIMNAPHDKSFYTANTMPEKFNRMVRRDRNHPSVICWSVVNEQCTYDYIHKKIFIETWEADNSRFLVNQSGGHFGDASGYIPHQRPYESAPRLDYIDDHTVDAKTRFQESDLQAHKSQNDSCIIYWGEVRCYCGPDNFYLLSNPKDTIGYDYKSWSVLGNKTSAYFKQNDFLNHPFIKSPADLCIQAGRGLMYIDARLGQAIQFSNATDGYAINGWSGADLSLGDDFLAWYSAICDEGRNLKGPATDFAYWIRPLQIAIARQNGKYFNPGETALFNIYLFNENKIGKGEYQLKIRVKDGNGIYTSFSYDKNIQVSSGDDFTQVLEENFTITFDKSWKAGYVTIEGTLLQNGKTITNGVEQVLLKNRNSYRNDFQDKSLVVINWDAAEKALTEAGIRIGKLNSELKYNSVILAGDVPDSKTAEEILKLAKSGAKVILKFDEGWANTLYENKILKENVNFWGGEQKGFWNGNGWGYVEKLIGNQAMPTVSCIGTNSWEPSEDPVGFEPFASNFRQKSYGAFFYRPDKLLTLFGEIYYGKGSILLAPSYPVDAENAFTDMLFFNMLH